MCVVYIHLCFVHNTEKNSLIKKENQKQKKIHPKWRRKVFA